MDEGVQQSRESCRGGEGRGEGHGKRHKGGQWELPLARRYRLNKRSAPEWAERGRRTVTSSSPPKTHRQPIVSLRLAARGCAGAAGAAGKVAREARVETAANRGRRAGAVEAVHVAGGGRAQAHRVARELGCARTAPAHPPRGRARSPIVRAALVISALRTPDSPLIACVRVPPALTGKQQTDAFSKLEQERGSSRMSQRGAPSTPAAPMTPG